MSNKNTIESIRSTLSNYKIPSNKIEKKVVMITSNGLML